MATTVFEVTEDGAYHIGFSAGKDSIYKIAVGSADPTYAITDGSTADDVALTFKVDGKAVTEAAAGATVTVEAEVQDPTNKVLDTITAKDADNANVTVTETEGVYTFTMPAKAVTVTATVKANEKTAQDILDAAVAAVKTELAKLTAIDQGAAADADAQTAAAKKAVEDAIAEVLNGATATVTVSDLTAATAGDETDEDGTNGSFKYSVALSVTKGEDTKTATVASTEITALTEGKVTITAKAKMYVRSDLSKKIGDARTLMNQYGAGATAADVFEGKKVISADTMKALTTAIAAAITVDNDKPNDDTADPPATPTEANSKKLKDAIDALNTAVDTFKTAVADASETGTRSKTPTGVKVLTGAGVLADLQGKSITGLTIASDKVTATGAATVDKMGTDGYFTITFANKDAVDSSGAGIFADGLQETHRVKITNGNGGPISFNVGTGKTADVQVWWVSNGNAVTFKNAEGTEPNDKLVNGSEISGVTKNTSAIAAWKGLPAGTYNLGGKNYIFRVEVVEKGVKATDIAIKGPAGNENVSEVTVGATAQELQMQAVLTPANAVDAVNWSISPENQGVSIDNTGKVTVAPTATAGNYTITATSAETSTVTTTRTLTVKAVAVDTVTIKKDGVAATTATVKYGEELTLTADVTFTGGGRPAQGDTAVTWSSSDETVATVGASTGVVTIKKEGSTKITATSVKDTSKKAELTLTVEKADVTLGIKTRNVDITSAGREVVFKVGTPGQAENTVVNLPSEVLSALTVKVTKDSGTDDLSTTLGLTQKETADEGAPMHWNYAMTLPANTSGAAEIYTVTVSFAGIENKYNAAQDVTATFKVVASGTKTIHINRQTEQGAVKTITSGDELVLSLDAMVELDGANSTEDTAKLVFTWTKDDRPITAVDSDCTEEGHVGHRQSTYTVAQATTADAGAYKCVITVQDDNTIEAGTATITVKVNKKAAAAPTTAAFEASTMTLSGVDATMEYSVDGGANWVAIADTTVDLSAAGVVQLHGIQVRVKATDEQEASEAQTIAVTRGATPVLTIQSETIVITNLVDGATYEIKSGEGEWADATVTDGKITGLTNDTAYQVRMKGKGTVLVSDPATATPRADAPDYSALIAAVDAARNAKLGVAVSADGQDVPTTQKWVTETVMTTFETALETAETALAGGATTAEQVAAAVTELNGAVEIFNTAKADGLKTEPDIEDPDQPGDLPSGGSTVTGGGSGVTVISGGNKSETVVNEDGSKTTTTVDKDGNKTIVTETEDGAKTEIVSKVDGEKTIKVTDAAGEELVSVDVPAEVPAPEAPFIDVPEDHWAKEAIDTIAGLGLVKGVDDVNHVYDMTSNITRGALASVLYRFSNGKAGLDSSFTDVATGAWYTDGVAWAAKVGVVTGYENGAFGPDNAITRQELAVMLYRYAKLIGMDVSTKADVSRFNDSAAVASWAKEAMTWCTESGIVKGVGGNTLNPEGVASRAECAVMLSRFIDLV